jgi:hypothetical protein
MAGVDEADCSEGACPHGGGTRGGAVRQDGSKDASISGWPLVPGWRIRHGESALNPLAVQVDPASRASIPSAYWAESNPSPRAEPPDLVAARVRGGDSASSSHLHRPQHELEGARNHKPIEDGRGSLYARTLARFQTAIDKKARILRFSTRSRC